MGVNSRAAKEIFNLKWQCGPRPGARPGSSGGEAQAIVPGCAGVAALIPKGSQAVARMNTTEGLGFQPLMAAVSGLGW
jgi:hypothetical protein